MSAPTGRRAIVTGAASGIGRAAALELLRQGARVVGLDLNPTDGIEVVVTDVADTDLVRTHSQPSLIPRSAMR